jgi:hypothetical protein
MMTDTTYTFRIDSWALDRAKENLAKLTKRADKLGVPAATMTVSPLIEVTHKDELTGYTKVKAYYDITVSVAPVKLAGWTLVAALDHIEDGVIVRVVPDMLLPARYQTAKANCDHCKHDRRRTTTFVLLHEDGRYAQVGSTCLHDFLGMDPTRLIAMGTYLRALAAMGEDMGGWGGGLSREHTESFLALIARLIEAQGWVSRKAAKEDFSGRLRATADEAGTVLYLASAARADERARREAQAMLASITDKHRTLATDALAWVRAKADEPNLSDYFHNLTVLTVGDSFESKYSGIVASLIPVYQRELGQQIERKLAAERNKASVHVGEVGKRMAVDLTVSDIKTFDGNYGVRTLVTFHDAAGNRYKWWTGEAGLDIGARYTGKATVKDHEVYKDVNWTVLTRASLSPVSEEVTK